MRSLSFLSSRTRITSSASRVPTCHRPYPLLNLSRSLSTPSTSIPSSESSLDPFYVTTPIFYVNAAPHVGHLHSMLLADLLARYARLRNPSRPVHFATGTDEHGQKIQNAAVGRETSEIAMCDENSAKFKALAEVATIQYTDFIRTTEPRHYKAVESFWNVLLEKGYVYKGSHSGWYAVSDECFYTPSQIQDGPGGDKVSIETGNKVEWMEEENYKFKLSAFQQPLLEWLNSNPKALSPARHQTALIRELSPPNILPDLSISRPSSRLSWGVPVPGDEAHTIYVWVDALTNYLTVLGYPKTLEKGGGGGQGGDGKVVGWPADVQVIGKDIIRFHAVYWPALLLAHGLPPPQTLLVHSHWTQGNSKMSKSRGNVADPFEAIQKAGVDSVRGYLLGVGGSLKEDSDYSYPGLLIHHKLMSDQIGNLLGRISGKKMEGKILGPESSAVYETVIERVEEGDEAIEKALREIRGTVEGHLEKFEVQPAFFAIMQVVAEANRHYTSLQPWTSSATPSQIARAYLYSHQTLRIAAILLTPYMPTLMPELLDALGCKEGEKRTSWESAEWRGPREEDGMDVFGLCKGTKEGMDRRGRKVLFARIEDP